MVRVQKSYDRLHKKWIYDVMHGKKFLTRARNRDDAQFQAKQFKKMFKEDKEAKKLWLG